MLVSLGLMLPLVLYWMGIDERGQELLSAPTTGGPYPFVHHQIYEEKGDVDALFLGSSLLWAAIDTPAVETFLSQRLQRPARALTFGFNWRGDDLAFAILRRLVLRRKVKTVFFHVGGTLQSQPHVLATRWMNYDDYTALAKNVSLSERLMLFGVTVLGSPRRLLDTLRAPLREEIAEGNSRTHGELRVKNGYNGAAFVESSVPAPSLRESELIRVASNTDAFATASMQPIPPYQATYLKKIGSFCREHAIRLVLLHIPTLEDVGKNELPVEHNWFPFFDRETPVVGATGKRLFGGLSRSEVEKLFYDNHLNANGNRYFTAALLPAFLRIYERYESPL